MLSKMVFMVMALSIAAFAQSVDTPEVRPFQLGIVYPLSTNGHEAPKVANHFSANLIWGVSAGVQGFEANGFGSTVHGDVMGYQTSGFMNVVDGSVSGVQTAGFMNILDGSVHGVQTAGFMNILDGNVRGAQAAGFMNIAEQIEVLQVAGFMNISKNSVWGAQVAGFMNITESVLGMQVAGFMNRGGSVNGLQTSGFMNIAEAVNGTQYAGFMNIAGRVNGLQVAGFMNIAERVEGLMVAGFLNVAESCAYPIGVINIIDDGWRTLAVSGDEQGTVGASFRSGSRTYGVIGGGYNAQEAPLQYGTHAALGLSQSLGGALSLNIEAGTAFYFEKWDADSYKDEVTQVHSLKVLFDYPLGKRFGLYAGPTLNLLQTNRSDAADLVTSSLWDRTSDVEYGKYQKLYAGATAGIYYRLKN